MKIIHTTTQPTQFPQFWNEEWLQLAIDELDKRKMTPDERFAYERTLAIPFINRGYCRGQWGFD